MSVIFINLVLAVVWGAVTGSFAPSNLVFGFVLGFFSLWVVRDRVNRKNFFRPFRILRLIWVFIKELWLSAYKVARDTLSPQMNFKPAMISLPLDLKGDAEIMLLANLISLTPGTLSVDVSTDKSTLYIHAMDVQSAEELQRDIKEGFEQLIKDAVE